MNKVLIESTFHNTGVTLRAKGEHHEISKSQLKRAYKKLCGYTGCLCGGHIRVYLDGKRAILLHHNEERFFVFPGTN